MVEKSTARIASTISAWLTAVFGPRFITTTGATGAGAIAKYTVERGTRKPRKSSSADSAVRSPG